MNLLNYSELIRHSSFEDRFNYLVLRGSVGDSTFGYNRYLNQNFYRSTQWKNVREHVIARDNGCDLAIPGYLIWENLIVHHMNPMVPDDIDSGLTHILDPEFLITVSMDTHNAIHYGGPATVREEYVARTPGDTKPW